MKHLHCKNKLITFFHVILPVKKTNPKKTSFSGTGGGQGGALPLKDWKSQRNKVSRLSGSTFKKTWLKYLIICYLPIQDQSSLLPDACNRHHSFHSSTLNWAVAEMGPLNWYSTLLHSLSNLKKWWPSYKNHCCKILLNLSRKVRAKLLGWSNLESFLGRRSGLHTPVFLLLSQCTQVSADPNARDMRSLLEWDVEVDPVT